MTNMHNGYFTPGYYMKPGPWPMSQSEVFRPSDAALLVRSSLQEGTEIPFSKRKMSSRPSTQGSGGYRFGQLSHNSFFTRHNPHPNRVTHIKGLLDIPICAVNDDGFLANPRFSMQLPPKYASPQSKPTDIRRIPVNASHFPSKLHPINTVTGLQNWTGLQNYPWRERAIPRVGLVPVTETWRDELRAFTELAVIPPPSPEKPKTHDGEKRLKTQYSANTGRIIPPSSRALTRGSRTGTRHKFRKEMEHIIDENNLETVVLTMLCQILQVEDLNSVQAWLCSAGDIEKNMALDLVRGALNTKDDYNSHEVPAEVAEQVKTAAEYGVLTEEANVDQTEQDRFVEKVVERLNIADGRFTRHTISRDDNGEIKESTKFSGVEPLPDIFKKYNPIPEEDAPRPTTHAFACKNDSVPGTAKSEVRLRMTTGSRPATQSMLVAENKEWNPNQATV